jgi:EGF-like domain
MTEIPRNLPLERISNYSFALCFSCTSNYVGEYCQHLNPCRKGNGIQPQCQNGGRCMVKTTPGNSQPSWWCECPIGYTASLCEIAVSNVCDSSPCLYGGNCVLKSLESYTCSCASGYTGKNSIQLLCHISIRHINVNHLLRCLSAPSPSGEIVLLDRFLSKIFKQWT